MYNLQSIHAYAVRVHSEGMDKVYIVHKNGHVQNIIYIHCIFWIDDSVCIYSVCELQRWET